MQVASLPEIKKDIAGKSTHFSSPQLDSCLHLYLSITENQFITSYLKCDIPDQSTGSHLYLFDDLIRPSIFLTFAQSQHNKIICIQLSFLCLLRIVFILEEKVSTHESEYPKSSFSCKGSHWQFTTA